MGLDLQAEQLKGQSAGGVKSQAISRAWNSTLVLRQVFAKKEQSTGSSGLTVWQVLVYTCIRFGQNLERSGAKTNETDFDD